MSFREQADKAAGAVAEAFGATPTPEQAKVASDCCAADRDLAHTVADQIQLANTALIANLSSLR